MKFFRRWILAVRLRLTRQGKKKDPRYRIIAIESAHPRDGRLLEVLGHYNPQAEVVLTDLNQERVKYWLGIGCKTSDVVTRLLANAGLIEKRAKVPVESGVSKKEKKARAESK